MVTIGPMKFGGSSRLHLDATFCSGSSSSSSSQSSSFRCKMHNGLGSLLLGRQVSPQRVAAHRPPNGKERDLSSASSSRSPKSSSNLINGGNAFDVEQNRMRNVSNHQPPMSLSSLSSLSTTPGSPAQYRRLESRRMLREEEEEREDSPKRQLPLNPGMMTRKTAVTPRACRKAVVTEVRTDQARVVHQQQQQQQAISRSIGLPKYNFNELSSGCGATNNKCRISCKSAFTHNRLIAVDKRDTQQSTSLNSHTISSLNKIVKSSMSSSNTSRDTSIESIVPKYKTIGLNGSAATTTSSPRFNGKDCAAHAEEVIKLNGVSSPQKRSYNPQMLVRTNKFILNDEKVVSRKNNVIIPRIRSSLNEKNNSTTHHVPIYRSLDVEQERAPAVDAFKVFKKQQQQQQEDLQRVPDNSVRSMHGRLYDDCDRDFFHRDPSNESLYIDFSKKRSPATKGNETQLSSLRPIHKEALLQSCEQSSTCDYTYKLEVTKQKEENSVASRSALRRLGGGGGCGSDSSRIGGGGDKSAVLPSVFYVSCASWMPKCNNKFSLRERRLLEESKTISRKR